MNIHFYFVAFVHIEAMQNRIKNETTNESCLLIQPELAVSDNSSRNRSETVIRNFEELNGPE
jgi:hypothetical protein